MRKLIKLIKEYPVLLGLAVVFLLSLTILGYKYQTARKYIEPTVVTEELSRESTIDGFEKAADVVTYVFSALKKNDLDMGLRAFPIDEKMLNMNTGKVLDSLGVFSTNNTYMTSAWQTYAPLSSVELTQDYTEEFLKLQEKLEGKEFTVKSVFAAFPDKQLAPEYRKNMQEKCEQWGADAGAEMFANIEIENKNYLIGITLLQYYDFWKIDSFSSSLLEEEGYHGVTEITEKDIAEFQDKQSEEKLWKELKTKDKKSNKKKTVENPENEMLVPNYFVLSASYGSTPEEVIEKFVLSIQKQDITMLMSLFENYEIHTQNIENVLIRQGTIGREVQSFYYYLLGNKFASLEEVQLETLGMTGNEIVKKSNPDELFYLDLVETCKVNDHEYLGVYYFNGKHYISGFNLIEDEEGWKIKSLSCEEIGLKTGQVKEASEKQYKEILKEYREAI